MLEADNEDNSVHAAELHQLEEEISRIERRLPSLRPAVLSFGAEIVEKAIVSAEKHRCAAALSVASQASTLRDIEHCCDEPEAGALGLGLGSPSPMDTATRSLPAAAGSGILVDSTVEAPLPPEMLRTDPTAIWSSTVGNDSHLRDTALRGTLKAKRLERQGVLSATAGPGAGPGPISGVGVGAGLGLGRRARGADNIVSLTSTSYSFY